MRVALITDTHVGVRNDSRNFSQYFDKFYTNVFFPYLKQHGIKQIIHLGDTFERRKYINFQSLGAARQYMFEPLNEFDVDMIVGNHDTYFKNSNHLNSPSLLLKDFKNINVHWQPTTKRYDGLDIALLPWICSGNYTESMEFLQQSSATTLMGHLEIMGFEMYMGSSNNDGFDPEIFNKFEQVFSGHFHHRSTRGNITYLGSPYETTWSDYADPRGFHIFDTQTRTLEFIENPYKMFHKIYFDDSETDIDELLSQDLEQYTNTYVRVVIKQKNNPYGFERFIDNLTKVNPIDISFTDDTLDLSFDDHELDDVEDTRAIIEQTVEQIAKEKPKIVKPLKKLMIDLYSEAVNMSRI